MKAIQRFYQWAGPVALLALVYFVLVPPPKPTLAQLIAVQTWAGTSGGTATAQTLAVHNVAALNDLLGVPIRFIPGATNTGATTLTINLDSGGTLGPVNVLRPTSNIGLQLLGGGELQVGQQAEVTYDGTRFNITSPQDMTPVGHTVDLRQSSGTAPLGHLIEDGTCYSTATYPALFAVIGSTYNAGAPIACTGGQFAVPDSRGSLFAAIDTQGAQGAANRITNAGSGCTATAIGTRCGGQNQTLTQAQLPSYNLLASVTTSTHGNSVSYQAGASGLTFLDSATSGPVPSGGSGLSHPLLNPVLLGMRAIKY